MKEELKEMVNEIDCPNFVTDGDVAYCDLREEEVDEFPCLPDCPYRANSLLKKNPEYEF